MAFMVYALNQGICDAGRRLPHQFGTADALATLGNSQGGSATAGPSVAAAEKSQLKPPGEWRLRPQMEVEPTSESPASQIDQQEEWMNNL